MAFTYDQIAANIRSRIFHPIYFLTGDEAYFIDSISELLEEHVLDESEKAFNMLVMYGRDVDVQMIASQARAYPMTGNYQLLIVREAQDVKDIEEIGKYLSSFPKSTILVFNYKYKKIDGRKTFAKTVDKIGVFYESKKLYPDNIPDWINRYLQQKNYSITPKAAQIMSDFLGNDLHKVRNELEKLMISLPVGSKITELEVESKIGISKDFNIFELQNALGRKDVLKANQIVNYFAANPKDHPIIFVMITLYGYFTKLLKYHYTPDKSRNNIASVLGVSPFFVNTYQGAAKNYSVASLHKIIAVLREYDLKTKGYGSSNIGDDELYREFIYKILHEC